MIEITKEHFRVSDETLEKIVEIIKEKGNIKVKPLIEELERKYDIKLSRRAMRFARAMINKRYYKFKVLLGFGNDGYFLIETKDKLQEAVKNLKAQAYDLLEQAKIIENAYRNFYGEKLFD